MISILVADAFHLEHFILHHSEVPGSSQPLFLVPLQVLGFRVDSTDLCPAEACFVALLTHTEISSSEAPDNPSFYCESAVFRLNMQAFHLVEGEKETLGPRIFDVLFPFREHVWSKASEEFSLRLHKDDYRSSKLQGVKIFGDEAVAGGLELKVQLALEWK